MTIPILYLVSKSLMVFNKVTDYIKEAPGATDVDSDLADLIKQQANTNTNTQIPVTNQNSNTVDISNALNNAINKNNVNNANNPNVNSSQYMNAHGLGGQQNSANEGFSLF